MFDNMTIDDQGRVLLQEDVGNVAHSSKIWMYDIATGALLQVAQHDPARFGDLGVPATAPFNQDEESSGIIDVSDILGPGTYLLDVQAHYNPGDPELVEGGQLLLMKIGPTAGAGFDTTGSVAVPAVVAMGTSGSEIIQVEQSAAGFEVEVNGISLGIFAGGKVLANGYGAPT